jgi:hypothetical protein
MPEHLEDHDDVNAQSNAASLPSMVGVIDEHSYHVRAIKLMLWLNMIVLRDAIREGMVTKHRVMLTGEVHNSHMLSFDMRRVELYQTKANDEDTL